MQSLEEYEEIEVVYVSVKDVQAIVFTAEDQNNFVESDHSDRSLLESSGALHDVNSLGLEQHLSSTQWMTSIHSLSDSEESDSSSEFVSDFTDSENEFGEEDNVEILEQVEDIDDEIYRKIGVQTYLRSLHWDSKTFNPLQNIDSFDYYPQDDSLSADMFFEVFSSRQKKSSGNSMTQISLLNDKELFDILSNLGDNFKDKKNYLLKLYEKEFDNWHFQLKEGFNILLYGYGSKKNLMDHFMNTTLSSEICIIVKGFFPALSLKNLLSMIYLNILNYADAPADIIQICNLIKDHYDDPHEKHKPPVYLLVHSIDGIALRSKKAQTILSLLGSIKHIHIIASIDHIKSPYLWDYYISGKLNFISHHVCTYEHYKNETKYETNPFISKASKGVLGIRAALMVLEGLPSRAHQVFSLLAEEQLQNNTGFSFKLLLRKCRERFILTNEHHLKGYMNEFKEHKLVKKVNNRKEGTELFTICMPSAYISKILAEIENGALGQ